MSVLTSGSPKLPWHNEPDEQDFVSRGFICHLRRHPQTGHWCGYVALPEEHPWVDKNLSEIPAYVHGGVTYAARPHESAGLGTHWLVGFDCRHGTDLTPSLYETLVKDGGESMLQVFSLDSYRTLDYAVRETMRLADQAYAQMPQMPSYEQHLCDRSDFELRNALRQRRGEPEIEMPKLSVPPAFQQLTPGLSVARAPGETDAELEQRIARTLSTTPVEEFQQFRESIGSPLPTKLEHAKQKLASVLPSWNPTRPPKSDDDDDENPPTPET